MQVLIESGTLVGSRGSYRLVAPIDKLEVRDRARGAGGAHRSVRGA